VDRQDSWRIYWCVGLLIATFARSYFGDPAHASANTRSAAFVAVWVIAFIMYATISYFQGRVRSSTDSLALIGLLAVIAFEVAWPISLLHNSHAGSIAGPLAGAILGTLWREHRRNRKHLPSGSRSGNGEV
jgi:hypothetical protein